MTTKKWTATRLPAGGWTVVGPAYEEATLSAAGVLEWGNDHEIGRQDGSTSLDLLSLLRRWQVPPDVLALIAGGKP